MNKKSLIIIGIVVFVLGGMLLCVGSVGYWYLFLRMDEKIAVEKMAKRIEKVKSYTRDSTDEYTFKSKDDKESTHDIKETEKTDYVNKKTEIKFSSEDVDFDGTKNDSSGLIYVDGSDYYVKLDDQLRVYKNNMRPAVKNATIRPDSYYKDFYNNALIEWKNLSKNKDKVEYLNIEKYGDIEAYKYKLTDTSVISSLLGLDNVYQYMERAVGKDKTYEVKDTEMIIWIGKKDGMPLGYELSVNLSIKKGGESVELRQKNTVKYSDFNRVSSVSIPDEIRNPKVLDINQTLDDLGNVSSSVGNYRYEKSETAVISSKVRGYDYYANFNGLENNVFYVNFDEKIAKLNFKSNAVTENNIDDTESGNNKKEENYIGEIYWINDDYYSKSGTESKYNKNSLGGLNDYLGDRQTIKEFWDSQYDNWINIEDYKGNIVPVGEEKYNDIDCYKYKVTDKNAVEKITQSHVFSTSSIILSKEISWEFNFWVDKNTGIVQGYSFSYDWEGYQIEKDSIYIDYVVNVSVNGRYTDINSLGNIDIPSEISE